MSLFISSSLVVAATAGDSTHWPAVLWENLVTLANVTAEHEVAANPATNLANGSTAWYWQSDDTGEQLITVDLSAEVDPVNAVGMQGHGFGTDQTVVSIEGLTAEPGASYEEIYGETLMGDDGPALFLFENANLIGLRVRLQPTAAAPRMSVLSVGRALRIQHGILPGHTPIVDGQDVVRVPGVSQGGDYLGDTVIRETLSSTARFELLDPSWYRESMRPFVHAANRGRPFFFAALPAWWPAEVGYCWLPTGFTARPTISQRAGHLAIELQMRGVAV